MRPNSPATEHRGRKEGPGAALIHVRPGQIIYHLVQTNSVLDSLSEEEGCAREGREGCQRRCSLTPITLPLISPPWPSPHYSTHAASEARVSVRRAARGRRPRSPVFIPHFLRLFPLFTAGIFAPHIKKFLAEGADLHARARPPLGADYKAREGGRKEPGGGGRGAG